MLHIQYIDTPRPIYAANSRESFNSCTGSFRWTKFKYLFGLPDLSALTGFSSFIGLSAETSFYFFV